MSDIHVIREPEGKEKKYKTEKKLSENFPNLMKVGNLQVQQAQ